MTRTGLFFCKQAPISGRSTDVGKVLFLRPFKPVKIRKCWRSPREPFRVLMVASFIFLVVGMGLGFLLFHMIGLVEEKKEVIQMTAMEKAALEGDLERLQGINRESTRKVFALISAVELVLDTVYDREKRTFLLRVIPLALKHQVEDHIPASALIAMAIYESNYGRSDLAREYCNYFGIKAWKSTWNGEVARMRTVDLGTPRMASFRVYPTLEAGINGYAQFISQSPRYRDAFQYEDGLSFVRELLKSGYCPDRDYLKRVKTIIGRHHLDRLDLQSLQQTVAVERGGMEEVAFSAN